MKSLIKKAVDWYFRRKSPAITLVKYGVALIVAAAAGWVLSVTIPSEYGNFQFSLSGEGNLPSLVAYISFFLGVALVLIGVAWEILRYRNEQLALSRNNIIVVEVRGLRDVGGTSLADSVSSVYKGKQRSIFVDLCQNVIDGEIINPKSSLNKLTAITHQVDQITSGVDRSDITMVYGGLAPVPFSFLTGVLLDDESRIETFDWDRNIGHWRNLSESDDNKRFGSNIIEGSIVPGEPEIILAISVSYKVNIDSVRNQFSGLPIVHMELQDGDFDSHWSEEKQAELGKQFLAKLAEIEAFGVKKIHIFVAAPNSLVFRFGKLYDKRNMPEVVVYQYKRGGIPEYPWGVIMPVSNIAEPALVSFGREC